MVRPSNHLDKRLEQEGMTKDQTAVSSGTTFPLPVSFFRRGA